MLPADRTRLVVSAIAPLRSALIGFLTTEHGTTSPHAVAAAAENLPAHQIPERSTDWLDHLLRIARALALPRRWCLA